jgi:hypothetical protein
VSARLIVKGGMSLDALSFRHALIQDAAYQSLLKSKRQQYHEAIARALIESLPETVRTQPELVAYHFTEAGIPEQAVPFWQRAGERALARSANYESVDHFKKAIELAVKLEDANDRSRTLLAARMSLGQAQRAAGHLKDAVATFRLAARQALEQDDKSALVTCALGFHVAQFLSNEPLQESIELLTEPCHL